MNEIILWQAVLCKSLEPFPLSCAAVYGLQRAAVTVWNICLHMRHTVLFKNYERYENKMKIKTCSWCFSDKKKKAFEEFAEWDLNHWLLFLHVNFSAGYYREPNLCLWCFTAQTDLYGPWGCGFPRHQWNQYLIPHHPQKDALTHQRVWFHPGHGDALTHNGCRAWLRPWRRRSRSIAHSYLLKVEPEAEECMSLLKFQAPNTACEINPVHDDCIKCACACAPSECHDYSIRRPENSSESYVKCTECVSTDSQSKIRSEESHSSIKWSNGGAVD